MGSWLSYGLGSENRNMPAFIVLHATWTGQPDAQALFNRLWGSGFLPSRHQGVLLRTQNDPVLFLNNPPGVSAEARQNMLSALAQLNQEHFDQMGDPETQPILMRLKSDLLDLLDAALDGKLGQAEAEWDRRAALGVVLAAHGYPDEPRKGDRIDGVPAPAADCRVFHAGTQARGADVVTSGGRVLCVTALGDNLRAARSRAYEAVERIRFDGMQYRKDIGHRALRK